VNPALITDAYREQQMQLHATGMYGRTGSKHGELVSQLLTKVDARSLLDYGCGSRCSLLETLRLPPGVVYEGYDPCVPEFAADPLPAELVVCIDVLEHIEPDLLDNVLDHLASLCEPYGYFTIHTGPAKKTLPDGRNAHLTQQPLAWWLPRLQQRFKVLDVVQHSRGIDVLVKRQEG
jgi:hypothetical protein